MPVGSVIIQEYGKFIGVVPSERQYRESFECNPTEVRRARKAIAAFAQSWLVGTAASDFESAVGEALSNAINHGHCKRVNVACRFVRQAVVAEIQQQNGAAFEPPANFEPPAVGAAGGYGLFIMRSVLDELEYHEHGRRVRLVKRAARA